MPPSFKTELRWGFIGVTLICLYLIYLTRQYSQPAASAPLPMNRSTATTLDLAVLQMRRVGTVAVTPQQSFQGGYYDDD